jgi:G3E family GTPase
VTTGGGRASHIEMRLNDSREALEQIAFADQIVLNKTDLVSEDELRTLEARIHRLNPDGTDPSGAALQREARRHPGRGGFDLNRITELEPEFLEPVHGEAGHVHDEHCEHDHDEPRSVTTLQAR